MPILRTGPIAKCAFLVHSCRCGGAEAIHAAQQARPGRMFTPVTRISVRVARGSADSTRARTSRRPPPIRSRATSNSAARPSISSHLDADYSGVTIFAIVRSACLFRVILGHAISGARRKHVSYLRTGLTYARCTRGVARCARRKPVPEGRSRTIDRAASTGSGPATPRSRWIPRCYWTEGRCREPR